MLTLILRALRKLPIFVLSAAALLLAGGLPAGATHIPGATYTGTHSGGGTLEFTVAGDGSGITSFKINNIPGDVCTFSEWSVTFSQGNIPITNHSFSYDITSGNGQGSSFSGTFPGTQSAQGSFRRAFGLPGLPRCDSGTLTW